VPAGNWREWWRVAISRRVLLSWLAGDNQRHSQKRLGTQPVCRAGLHCRAGPIHRNLVLGCGLDRHHCGLYVVRIAAPSNVIYPLQHRMELHLSRLERRADFLLWAGRLPAGRTYSIEVAGIWLKDIRHSVRDRTKLLAGSVK
jgi:hypothetical protein